MTVSHFSGAFSCSASSPVPVPVTYVLLYLHSRVSEQASRATCVVVRQPRVWLSWAIHSLAEKSEKIDPEHVHRLSSVLLHAEAEQGAVCRWSHGGGLVSEK